MIYPGNDDRGKPQREPDAILGYRAFFTKFRRTPLYKQPLKNILLDLKFEPFFENTTSEQRETALNFR